MGQLTEWIAVPLLVNASNRFSPSCVKGQKTGGVKVKARQRSRKFILGIKRTCCLKYSRNSIHDPWTLTTTYLIKNVNCWKQATVRVINYKKYDCINMSNCRGKLPEWAIIESDQSNKSKMLNLVLAMKGNRAR